MLMCCVLCSCHDKTHKTLKQAEASMPVDKADSILEWPKASTVSYESLIENEMDSVVVLPLQEKSGQMLGQIVQIQHLNDTLVISDNKRVCLYNSEGEYLSSIGAVGHGPNEYLSLGGMYIVEDSIYIKDVGVGRILTYNVDGKLTNTRNFADGAPQEFCILNDGIVLGAYSGYRPNSLFRLVVFDAKMDIMGTSFPYTEPQEYVAGRFIKQQHQDALFAYPLCDTIFKVTATKVTPVICMNLQDNQVVSDFIDETSDMSQEKFIQKLYGTDNLVNEVEVYPYHEGWFLYYQNSKGSYYSFVNSQQRKDYVRSDIEKQKLYYPFSIISLKDNWVYGYIDPSSLSYMDADSRNKWMVYIKDHALRPLSDLDIKNAVPLVVKMHIRQGGSI